MTKEIFVSEIILNIVIAGLAYFIGYMRGRTAQATEDSRNDK